MKQLLTATIIVTRLAPISANAEQITLLDSNDFSWKTTPEGVAFAALQRDRFTESHQALVRLPAGTVSPTHVKSENIYGVMMKGEMKHYAHGEDPDTARKIGAGSFCSISSGTVHISACVYDEPCVAYLYQDGDFDFFLVQQ